MPTRTELIPCIKCGQPRPIRSVHPGGFRRAAARVCVGCANRASVAVRYPRDVDDLAVKFLVDGVKINVTPAERTQAVAILTARKLSVSAIATRIGCTPRTVQRHRARMAAA